MARVLQRSRSTLFAASHMALRGGGGSLVPFHADHGRGVIHAMRPVTVTACSTDDNHCAQYAKCKCAIRCGGPRADSAALCACPIAELASERRGAGRRCIRIFRGIP